MGRISGRNYVIHTGKNAFQFWDFRDFFGIFGISKSQKSAFSPLVRPHTKNIIFEHPRESPEKRSGDALDKYIFNRF